MLVPRERGVSFSRLYVVWLTTSADRCPLVFKKESPLDRLFRLPREGLDIAELCVTTSLLNMHIPGSYYFLLIPGRLSKPGFIYPARNGLYALLLRIHNLLVSVFSNLGFETMNMYLQHSAILGQERCTEKN